MSDAIPLLLGEAPGGWERIDDTRREVAFQNRNATTVVAAQTADGPAPTAPLAADWELRVRQRVGEDIVEETVTRRATRETAVDAVLECTSLLTGADGYVPPRELADRLDRTGEVRHTSPAIPSIRAKL